MEKLDILSVLLNEHIPRLEGDRVAYAELISLRLGHALAADKPIVLIKSEEGAFKSVVPNIFAARVGKPHRLCSRALTARIGKFAAVYCRYAVILRRNIENSGARRGRGIIFGRCAHTYALGVSDKQNISLKFRLVQVNELHTVHRVVPFIGSGLAVIVRTYNINIYLLAVRNYFVHGRSRQKQGRYPLCGACLLCHYDRHIAKALARTVADHKRGGNNENKHHCKRRADR